jgi:hypothetical protein
MRRTAQEEGLAILAEATNEDDYPEPFLRLAYDLPPDLTARAIELAAEVTDPERPDRRAQVFTGLAQEFSVLHRQDREAAAEAWTKALRRLAIRPRPQFLKDMVGFHLLGRVLAGPEQDESFREDLMALIKDVCRWDWTRGSATTGRTEQAG